MCKLMIFRSKVVYVAYVCLFIIIAPGSAHWSRPIHCIESPKL
jgi:hypothetical protein